MELPDALTPYEDYVEVCACRWSSDPDVRDDLRQEMWLAILKVLKRTPDVHRGYIHAVADNACDRFLSRIAFDGPMGHDGRRDPSRMISIDDLPELPDDVPQRSI